jgi:hypothetical protein
MWVEVLIEPTNDQSVKWSQYLMLESTHYHNTGGSQVNAHATSFCRQEEYRYIFILGKLINKGLADIHSGGSC